MQTFDALDGALLIDKPPGLTSHDVVDHVRRHFQLKKVGHCGTLDPAATGLLILVLGKATKLSEKLMGADKIYEGTIKLGETTDSCDADGELISSLPVPVVSLEELNQYASELQGDQMQVPPMVSAIKVKGVPLYKLARKGIEVERKPRLIRVYYYKVLSYQEPILSFKIACTKGTYVRVLAEDLGKKLGCGAHLHSLRRTKSGSFEIDAAVTLDQLNGFTLSQLSAKVIPFLKLAQPEEPV